jgi:hypothetical protein
MHLHLYADDESIDVLAALRPKAMLIGSDGGYGNFGDVLQHKGSASRLKAASGLAVASILMLDAISRHVDVATLRRGYGVDALGFVSERPIAPEVAARLRLREVAVLRNVSYVQLYGGGFLNEMWGDFVLGVAEHFLERLPGAAYVISGQQISPAFASRVRDHVAKFKPQLVGVRDWKSAKLMADQGVCADFSFDDAVEPLLELRDKLDLRKGEGAFVHLNTSGYTSNSGALDDMAAHLRLVAGRVDGSGKLVLFQAFQDAREEVVDSIETVKRLESGFPFVDVETVMLITAAMGGERSMNGRALTGQFGYSSSYHVALWLQLSGIPCWLRGSNEYYRQKRAALGVEGEFEDFLDRMHCPDHGEGLHARSQWVDKLVNILGHTESVENRIVWEVADRAIPERVFNFKGEPRMEERLSQAWQVAERVHGLEQGLAREVALSEALKNRMESQLEEAESRIQACNSQLEEAESRIQACSMQLTEVGADARYYRDQYLSMQSSLQQAAACTEQLQLILNSRSWRFTRPLRVASRFLATGRFDPAHEVGVFGMLRIIGGRLPIKARWRSAAGRMLRRFRRR